MTTNQKRYLRLKRAMDFILALLALLILALPMLALALVQKLAAPREPVLFRQERLGRYGRPFMLLKFRTMTGGDWARVTRFGHFLRVTSIDELPQLVHVLTGRMSLIGPRPLIPREQTIHALRRDAGVYQLRPGLTGWAQINGRTMISDTEKAAYDREYLENLGFAMDWKIFWITIQKVLSRADVREDTPPAEDRPEKP